MSKMLSNNQIDKFIKANKELELVELKYKDLDDNDIIVVVNPNVTIENINQSVTDIADWVFDPDTNEYTPSYFKLGYGYALLHYFTNIKTEDMNVTERLFPLVYKTSIVDDIAGVLGQTAENIDDDAWRLIKHRREMSYKSTKADALYDTIIDIVDKLDNVLTDTSDSNIGEIIEIASKIANKNESEIVENILDYRSGKSVDKSSEPSDNSVN